MAKKSKKVVEVEEDIEDEELEELEDDVEETAPKAKKNKNRKNEVVFGASQLAELLTEQTGKTINARGLRVLLRKMARDGRLDREVKAGDRTRYNWSGPNDPEVKQIIKAVTSGELEQGQKEALDALKAKKAGAKTPAKKAKAAKKAAPVEDDDDEEIDFDEDE